MNGQAGEIELRQDLMGGCGGAGRGQPGPRERVRSQFEGEVGKEDLEDIDDAEEA